MPAERSAARSGLSAAAAGGACAGAGAGAGADGSAGARAAAGAGAAAGCSALPAGAASLAAAAGAAGSAGLLAAGSAAGSADFCSVFLEARSAGSAGASAGLPLESDPVGACGTLAAGRGAVGLAAAGGLRTALAVRAPAAVRPRMPPGALGSGGPEPATRPSRSALRRTRSAWASCIDDDALFTPMPRDSARRRVSSLLRPSSLERAWMRIFAGGTGGGCPCRPGVAGRAVSVPGVQEAGSPTPILRFRFGFVCCGLIA